MEPWKMKFTVIIFKVGAFLSFLGTGFVIYEVLTDRQKRAKTYFRLLLGLSVMEFVESLVLFCGTWCTPSDWVWWGASGNETTCKFQGFLNQFSIGSSLYSGFLALYYLLTIRGNVVERKIRKYYEPWMHLISISWSLGTSISALILDLIRPLGTICYIGRTPPKCEQTFQYGYTTCTQGDNAMLYLYVFYYSWFFFSFIFTLVAMMLVWLAIRQQENRMVRYDVTEQGGSSSANRNLSQRFAMQGTLYVAVMWLCNVWSVINFTRIQAVGTGIPQISMMASVFKPLEGFLNFLIYIRPRLLLKTRRRPAVEETTVSQTEPDYSDATPRERLSFISNRIGSIMRLLSARNLSLSMENENKSAGEQPAEAARKESPPPRPNDRCVESSTLSALISTRGLSPGVETELLQDAEEQMRLGAY